jgi:hypothetical protein
MRGVGAIFTATTRNNDIVATIFAAESVAQLTKGFTTLRPVNLSCLYFLVSTSIANTIFVESDRILLVRPFMFELNSRAWTLIRNYTFAAKEYFLGQPEVRTVHCANSPVTMQPNLARLSR